MRNTMHKSNVTLIGMPGCGKSTIGVLLAKALNLQFVDTDLLIQQKHGKFLWEILAEEGIERFKAKEEQVVCALECKKTCIATGGSVVYSAQAMHHLQAISQIIFIDLPCEEILRRVADIRGRGVVIDTGKTLPQLYDERRPLYLQYADVIVDAQGKPVEELLDAITQHAKV